MTHVDRSRTIAFAFLGAAIVGVLYCCYLAWNLSTSVSTVSKPVPDIIPDKGEAAAARSESSEMLKMASAAFEACGAPTAPVKVPDGKSATREQMVAAHETVQAFDEATNIYTRCLDTTAYQTTVQFKSVAKDSDTEALNTLQVRLHNEAIDRDQELANRFNVQLRIFKARK